MDAIGLRTEDAAFRYGIQSVDSRRETRRDGLTKCYTGPRTFTARTLYKIL